jgi:hypothetical protein
MKMNIKIWNNWINRIHWILDIAKKRNWDYSELVIKEPVSVKAFEMLENELVTQNALD